jgi:hypothetical protein
LREIATLGTSLAVPLPSRLDSNVALSAFVEQRQVRESGTLVAVASGGDPMRLLSMCCVVGLLFTGTATASPIGIELISGATTNALNASTASVWNAFGEDFSMTITLGHGGFFNPSGPYEPGTPIAVHAGWSGIDALGTITYQGVTYPLGQDRQPGVLLDFQSDIFTVPPLDGAPVMLVPFTLTGTVFGLPSIGAPVDLHGTGTMEFTFSVPFTGPRSPNGVWDVGKADFTIEQTPEPSAVITLAAALGGLGVMSRRRFRSWVGAGDAEDTVGSD